jgi:predicted component of type VI protein secretion system
MRGYHEASKKPEKKKPAEPVIEIRHPARPIVISAAPAPAPAVVRVESSPVKASMPVICGLCHDWAPLQGDRVNGYCAKYKRVFSKDNKECPVDKPAPVVKPRPPKKPINEIKTMKDESPGKLSESAVEERLRALDVLRAIADDEELSYEDEKKALAVIKQNHYQPPGFIDEITNPKNREKYKDIVDFEALKVNTLSVRENTEILKNVWRGEAYA